MQISIENDISYNIRKAVFKVYNQLGPGLLEIVYEKALLYELKKQGLKAESQVRVPLLYDGIELGVDFRIDILVENKVIIELKSVEQIHEVYYKQLLTYLKLTNKKLGLLINFNTEDMTKGIKRIVNGL